MMRREINALFCGWKKVCSLEFVRAFLKDPTCGIFLLKIVLVVFFADIFYIIFTPVQVREDRRK